MTLAPSDAATSEVRSVELLSTTMTSSTNSGRALSTLSTPCSSLRQGMMTVMVWPLYMGPSFWSARASRYHGSHEAIPDSAVPGWRDGVLRGAFGSPLGVHHADGA